MTRTLTDSQVSMWKTVIALIHADGITHPEEVNFIKDHLDKLQLEDNQRAELEKSLARPGSVDDNFKQITEPRDKSQFIYFARLLLWSDGDFSEQERKIHEQLHENVINAVDLREVMKQLDETKANFKEWQENQKQEQPLHRKIINTLVFWDDLDSVD